MNLFPDALPRLVALVDAAVWAAWSVAVGYRAARLPLSRLAEDGWLTRPRSWERGGRFYERFAIVGWKDRLPEAGSVFKGGTSKRALPGRSDEDLRRFAAETRRAELVHWQIMAITPVFLLFNPPVLIVAMVAYAVVANVPFIAIQRYNRLRILRILDRRAAREAVRAAQSWPPGACCRTPDTERHGTASRPGGRPVSSAGTGEGVPGPCHGRSDGAAGVVVVDQAHRLHEREHRRRPDEAPATPLQVGRQGLRRQ